MKILFVWPNKDSFGFKPMSLSLLSALLKQKGHDVLLFDTTFIDFGIKDRIEVRNKFRIFKKVDSSAFDVIKKKVDLEEEFLKTLDDFNPDIVAVSALSDEIHIGFKISKIAKKWNDRTIVVWGNKAATMTPERVLSCKDVDFVCIGEGVDFMPEFVECISRKGDPRKIMNIAIRGENGNIIKSGLKPYYQDLDALPFFDWSIFDKNHFFRPYDGEVYTGGDHMLYWGCANQCTYCINDSYRKLYGPKAGPYLRHYSVDRIIGELKYLVDKWNISFFKFHDENFCLKPINYFRELAEKYRQEIGVPFTILANARPINKEKVELLKKMNCVSVTMGIETGCSRLRKEVLKRVETKEEIIEAIHALNDAGIRTSAFNMLGIPFENRETVMETIELNKEAEVRYPNAGFFFPLEGTELRKIAIENGFFDETTDALFQNERPFLSFPDISEEELVALRERFTLYVKMPRIFYKYIQASERNNEIGKELTDELYMIYEECVFANDGIWNDHGKLKEYLKSLGRIFTKGKESNEEYH